LGWNEWAIRMPSVMANLGIVVTFLYFSRKYLYNIKIGLLSAVILFTTKLYVDTHISRTGDADALLCFFTFSAALLYFLFIRSNLKKNKYFFVCIMFICLGGLTKGIAGLLILPGLLIYTLYKGKFLPIIKNKAIYIPIVMAFALFAVYYFSREMTTPGYLKAVFENEIGGRFFGIKHEKQPIWFYFRRIFSLDFFPWVLLLIPSFFFINKRLQLQKDLVRFLFVNIGVFLLIISLSQTKSYWNLAPTLPMFALLFAYTFFELVLNYFQFSNQTEREKKGIVSIVLLCFLIPSCLFMFNRLNDEQPRNQADQYSFFVQTFMDKHKNYYISNAGYPRISFYVEKAQKNGTTFVPIAPSQAKIGKRILICTDKDWAQIEGKFLYNIIQKQNDCALLEILKRI